MEDKITVGLFVDTFFPMIDGVYMVVDNYAKRLLNYCNVIVFAPEYPGIEYDDSRFQYKIVRCKSLKLPIIDYRLPIPKLDKKFKKLLNTYNLDIVHIHSPFAVGKMGIDYAKKRNIPIVATIHSQYKQDFLRAVKINWIANILTKVIVNRYNKCDECLAVGSETARIFYEEYHYKTMPKVVNNATNMLPLKDKKEAYEIINKKHNIKENEKVFLFVGRINALKNIFFIVKSLKILKELNPNLKFKMLFVGTGQDEKELKKCIISNNMENDILLCGKITDRELLAMYYARADLFLFPSLYDTSSIVQIEAASQNTPTLFLEGAATTSTIQNNKNGFISKNSELEYAKSIIDIMKNTELYSEVSKNCYNDLYIHWDTVVENVYNNYRKTIL